jgi:ABC-type branched-subunit amino acid transport system ATPase component
MFNIMNQNNHSLLKVHQLSKWFGGLMAVNQVNFQIYPGEILGLIGPNGAGKTTIFNLMTGFHPVSRGKIYFKDERVDVLSPQDIVSRGIVRTFQNLQIFDNMSVVENVMVGLHRHGSSGMLDAALQLPVTRREDRECHQKALHYLEMVELVERADDLAGGLPFGQQRLLEVARALAIEPELLLLDEPAAGLTSSERIALDDLISGLREDGLTILLVEHDMELVMGIVDRLVVLHYGTKIAEGTPQEIQSNPDVIQAYLGADWQEDGLFGWQHEDVNKQAEVSDA